MIINNYTIALKPCTFEDYMLLLRFYKIVIDFTVITTVLPLKSGLERQEDHLPKRRKTGH